MKINTAILVESAREIPVHSTHDVIVCGGGPAGIAAALSCARAGAKTLIIEARGSLGGIWTTGLLPWVLDAGPKTGVMAELIRRIDEEKMRSHFEEKTFGVAFEAERMRELLERLCLEAGVAIRLHSPICAAQLDTNGRLTHVITESKSGREAWAAKVFIDCTGDGDLAARCGCGFDLGKPETGKTQPFSLQALLGGAALDDIRPYVAGWKGVPNTGNENHRQGVNRLKEALIDGGLETSFSRPMLFPIHDGLYMLLANHEYGYQSTNADDITEATLHARREMHTLADTLRRIDGPLSDLRLLATSEHIGMREGRRIHGLYQVTIDDVTAGARHEDAVCRVEFGIDVHSTDKNKSKGFDSAGSKYHGKSQPYDIPLRALIAKDVEGLMMAGRCISGDFLAHSSYRVTGNAVAMGEAAGVAAAASARTQTLPSQLNFSQIIQRISESQTL